MLPSQSILVDVESSIPEGDEQKLQTKNDEEDDEEERAMNEQARIEGVNE